MEVGRDSAAVVFTRAEKSQGFFRCLQTKDEIDVGSMSGRKCIAQNRAFAHYRRGDMWRPAPRGTELAARPKPFGASIFDNWTKRRIALHDTGRTILNLTPKVGKWPSLPLRLGFATYNRQGWQRCVFELGDSPRPPARDGKNGVWGNAPDTKNSPWLNLLVEKRGALGGVVTEPILQPSELNQTQTRLRALRYGAVNQLWGAMA